MTGGRLGSGMAVAWCRRVVWQWSRAHLVHVRVEEAVAEADRGRFVRVAVGQLHVHAPASTVVRACSVAGCNYVWRQVARRAGQRAGRAHCLWARGRRRRCRSGYRPPGPPYSRTSSWREARGASIQGAKRAEGLAGLWSEPGAHFWEQVACRRYAGAAHSFITSISLLLLGEDILRR